MNIREFEPSDLKRLIELHADGITPTNEFPDPANPLTLIKQCVVDGERIVAAGLARLELNVTLVLDHSWSTPKARFEAVKLLQDEMNKKAYGFGLDWAYAEAGPRFGRRLQKLGWIPAKDGLYFLRIQ
jgi:hypothetical protein